MMDFWFAFAITLLITLITVLLDRITSKLIVYGRTVKNMQDIIKKGLSNDDAIKYTIKELDQYESNKVASKIWGSDVAIVSISIDITALGIYISNRTYFPFFQRFDGNNASRDILVWIIVIFAHLILIMFSMIMKHNYLSSIDQVEELNLKQQHWWLKISRWSIGANACGFFTLLSAITIITNAV